MQQSFSYGLVGELFYVGVTTNATVRIEGTLFLELPFLRLLLSFCNYPLKELNRKLCHNIHDEVAARNK